MKNQKTRAQAICVVDTDNSLWTQKLSDMMNACGCIPDSNKNQTKIHFYPKLRYLCITKNPQMDNPGNITQ